MRQIKQFRLLEAWSWLEKPYGKSSGQSQKESNNQDEKSSNKEDNLSVQEGIRRERALLAPIRDRADVVIDTSLMDPQQHRQRLLQEFLGDVENGMSLILSSFGFKYGVPQDSNYVLDVRLLPNPFYVPELKPLMGMDPAVREYLLSDRKAHV